VGKDKGLPFSLLTELEEWGKRPR